MSCVLIQTKTDRPDVLAKIGTFRFTVLSDLIFTPSVILGSPKLLNKALRTIFLYGGAQ